jgi:ABC-type nitrate/sulfonate/bicarbonate transport system, ATPase component
VSHAVENPKISVNNLTKRYGELTVIDNISFSVRRNELLAIVGPTGCGKTTFLNMLSRLTPPTHGDILIDGVPADPHRHNIAFVFQEPTCLPWKTVRENVAYGMAIKGVPKQERSRRALEIMEIVGLADCMDLYPNQVSASMLQRIAVSRAFAARPDLLLMDEPYGQLDVKLRFHLEDELIRLWEKVRSTVLLITHNIEEAVYVADRVIVLTNKPTTIKAELTVDLPRPRDVVSPEFVGLRKKITELIRWW